MVSLIFLPILVNGQVQIKDSLFLQALIDIGVDTNQDGQIQQDEADAVEEIEIQGVDLVSIRGIEAFTNLKEITIVQTDLDSADLRFNSNLTLIQLSNNVIEHLLLDGLKGIRVLKLRSNELTSLDVTEFLELDELDVYNNELTNLDLSNSSKLTDLEISNNKFSGIDLSGAINLIHFDASNNPLDSLDFTFNTKLRNIQTSNTNISQFDVKHLPDLLSLVITGCPVQSLDIAGLDNLFTLWLNDSEIETVFMKGTSPDPSQLQFDNAPLKYICADQEIFPRIFRELEFENIEDCLVTSICPATDEGVFGGISGRVKFGQSDRDCDTSSNYVPYPKLQLDWLNASGRDLGVLVGPKDGSYNINYYGTMTLRPGLIYFPEWQYTETEFTASNYKSNPQFHIKDFCVVPLVNRKDVQIGIIPLQAFRAGFVSELQLVIRNTGTQPITGKVKLHLPTDTLAFISSSENPLEVKIDRVTWELNDLRPFQEKRIKVVMRLNSPVDDPPIFGNELVGVCVEVDDEDQFRYEECIQDITVNSFDPNDKTYLGKDTVRIDQIGSLEELTYLIRFENTGSAEAANIVILDSLDQTFLDPLSLQIVDASHPVELEMNEDAVVKFVFKDIDLPFETGQNTGYVLFTILSRFSGVTVGDQFKNRAGIYFDFNYPIITNDATITIIDRSNKTQDNFHFDHITAFPNPFSNELKIDMCGKIHGKVVIECFEFNGLLAVRIEALATNGSIYLEDLSQLKSGHYTLRFTTNKEEFYYSVIKQ